MKKWLENPKEPFQLFRIKDGTMVPVETMAGDEIWTCGECGIIASKSYNDEDPKTKAANCCKQRYCECGTKLEPYWLKCSSCRSTDHQNKLFNESVEVENYEGALYDDDNGSYYFTVDEFLDHVACAIDDEEEENLPEYLYACVEEGFGTLDAHDVIESRICEMYEDAQDAIVDLEGFQKYLDKWCKKQTIKSYSPDYKRKINVAKLCDIVKQSQKQ